MGKKSWIENVEVHKHMMGYQSMIGVGFFDPIVRKSYLSFGKCDKCSKTIRTFNKSWKCLWAEKSFRLCGKCAKKKEDVVDHFNTKDWLPKPPPRPKPPQGGSGVAAFIELTNQVDEILKNGIISEKKVEKEPRKIDLEPGKRKLDLD